jgi:hypothetical protein
LKEFVTNKREEYRGQWLADWNKVMEANQVIRTTRSKDQIFKMRKVKRLIADRWKVVQGYGLSCEKKFRDPKEVVYVSMKKLVEDYKDKLKAIKRSKEDPNDKTIRQWYDYFLKSLSVVDNQFARYSYSLRIFKEICEEKKLLIVDEAYEIKNNRYLPIKGILTRMSPKRREELRTWVIKDRLETLAREINSRLYEKSKVGKEIREWKYLSYLKKVGGKPKEKHVQTIEEEL